MHMNQGGTMELEQLTAMTILVIDKSEQDHFKILEQLEQLERAGHRVVHAGANQDTISGLLDHRSHLAMSTVLTHDGITVDQEQRRVHVHGAPLTLSRLEFELLVVLIESPMRVHTHGELAERVWGNYEVGLKAISVLASRLRRRVIDAGGPKVAEAVHGVGYRLACVG
jgi:DNA-binding response OmpR family regulator